MKFRIPSGQERVDALRSQIEAGTYAANPQALADAMFEHFFGAEGEFVQDLGSCPIDRLPRAECLALGRCSCNQHHRDLQDSDSSVSPQDEALAG